MGSPVIDVTVKKDSLQVYVLNLFGILTGLCGCLVASEREWDTKGPGSSSRFDPGLRFSFFFIETLS